MKLTITPIHRICKCHVKDCPLYTQKQLAFENERGNSYLYLCIEHYNCIMEQPNPWKNDDK